MEIKEGEEKQQEDVDFQDSRGLDTNIIYPYQCDIRDSVPLSTQTSVIQCIASNI